MRFLRDSGLGLTVYPVNPHHDEIGGYRAYPRPAALPEPPDVALVVVPAPGVPAAIEALADRGTRAAIVVSSGFAEATGAGPRSSAGSPGSRARTACCCSARIRWASTITGAGCR